MSYYQAKKCFDENVKLLGLPSQDRLMWNLNVGLTNLVFALEADLAEMERKIDQILKAQPPR